MAGKVPLCQITFCQGLLPGSLVGLVGQPSPPGSLIMMSDCHLLCLCLYCTFPGAETCILCTTHVHDTDRFVQKCGMITTWLNFTKTNLLFTTTHNGYWHQYHFYKCIEDQKQQCQISFCQLLLAYTAILQALTRSPILMGSLKAGTRHSYNNWMLCFQLLYCQL